MILFPSSAHILPSLPPFKATMEPGTMAACSSFLAFLMALSMPLIFLLSLLMSLAFLVASLLILICLSFMFSFFMAMARVTIGCGLLAIGCVVFGAATAGNGQMAVIWAPAPRPEPLRRPGLAGMLLVHWLPVGSNTALPPQIALTFHGDQQRHMDGTPDGQAADTSRLSKNWWLPPLLLVTTMGAICPQVAFAPGPVVEMQVRPSGEICKPSPPLVLSLLQVSTN